MGLLDHQLHQDPTELGLAKPLSMETQGEAHQSTKVIYLLTKIKKNNYILFI